MRRRGCAGFAAPGRLLRARACSRCSMSGGLGRHRRSRRRRRTHRRACGAPSPRRDPTGSVSCRGSIRYKSAHVACDRRPHPQHRVIDPSLVARVRTEVASGLDPSMMLTLYADPARRLTLRERVRATVVGALSEDQLEALCAELFGFGPVQPLLDDDGVTDVLVNGPKQVFVERNGRLERVDVAFRDAAAVSERAHRIAAGVGRELTIERPYVDARMRDGSRANAVIAPVGGPTISIRKFARVSLGLRGPAPSWEANNGLAGEAAALLARVVVARGNVLVSGSTGAGKSTFLRSLAGEI